MSVEDDDFDLAEQQRILLYSFEVPLKGGDPLKGGYDTKTLDSLYIAFWAIIRGAQNTIRKPDTAKLLSESKILNDLIKSSSTAPAQVQSIPNINFSKLSPTLKNLIMAVGDANIKLTRSEENITNELSLIYSQTAKNATQLFTSHIDKVLVYENSFKERLIRLHFASTQRVLGEEFGLFQIRALQALNEWTQIASRFGVKGLPNQDLTSIPKVLESLQEAKRLLEAATFNKTLPTVNVTSTDDSREDARLNLRMEIHKNNEIRSKAAQEFFTKRSDPVALAKTLQILKAGDEEAKAALSLLSNHEIPQQTIVPFTMDTVLINDAKKLSETFMNLIDSAHILNIRTIKLKDEIKEQLQKENTENLRAMHDAAMKDIDAAQGRLAMERSKALSRHNSAVEEMKESVKTILAEISTYSNSEYSSKEQSLTVELCLKSIENAVFVNKSQRDEKELLLQKVIISDLMKQIKIDLLRLHDSLSL